VAHGEVICFSFEYDGKIMIPLLITCFDWLTPISQACAIITPISQACAIIVDVHVF
jgi:hypothetical protein